ncbi:MAG: enoyl-CoA hydratase/isomerase family protein [Deltaproteobacteria bacterium]|nr:enoyl-CoA hydratase/isomerase family protein [Deltaproteobacteria bacterium]
MPKVTLEQKETLAVLRLTNGVTNPISPELVEELLKAVRQVKEENLGLTFPLPTACAIAGHAPAGGTVLALACDYRFAASGRKLIGLNEVQLGLPVPQITDSIMRQIVGDREATELLYQGDLIEPARAQQIGLVDEIHPLEEVEDRAVEKIAKLAALPHPALTAIKANRVEAVRLTYEKNKEIKNQEFLDCWFSQPVQELLAKTAEKF